MTVTERYRLLWKPAIWVACLAPLVLMALGAAGIVAQLGPDPVSEIIHRSGRTALNLALLGLLITPLRQLAGWSQLLRVRRLLGLFAFFYALLHLAVYVAIDQGLDAAALRADVLKRPYVTVGLAALLLLVPLAATSTAGMMRRLGRRWQLLHRLVYPASALAVLHFWWQVKADIRQPLLYAALLAALLGVRAWHARRITSRCAPATAQGRT